jgi:hypothetical protein
MTLLVRIKKKTDGGAALSCERADGSVTWQRQEGRLGAFFPLHDLTHFAVESVLGFQNAFYGLVSQGWDISRFEAPGAAKTTPAEALLAELIVGFFDVERATGHAENADDFNWKIDTHHDERGLPRTSFRLTDEQLTGIRAKRAELFGLWQSVPPGETLELRFQ